MRYRCVGALFLVTILLVTYTVWSDLEPIAGCESEGIYYIQHSLFAYIKSENTNVLPSVNTLSTWVKQGKTQERDASAKAYEISENSHYNWGGMFGEITKRPERALVWCNHTHGPFWRRYKNVIFSDGSLRSVPLSQFQNLFASVDSSRNAKYKCVHQCVSIETMR